MPTVEKPLLNLRVTATGLLALGITPALSLQVKIVPTIYVVRHGPAFLLVGLFSADRSIICDTPSLFRTVSTR